MAYVTAEKVGWSAAPEISQGVARQKAECDEIIAQIRSGNFQPYYQYAFGKLERFWSYICAVGKRSGLSEQIGENGERKERLMANINNFNQLCNQPETLRILEEQRLRELNQMDANVIQDFVAFYDTALDVGVAVGLLSWQKGGDAMPDKKERGMGVPFVPGVGNV